MRRIPPVTHSSCTIHGALTHSPRCPDTVSAIANLIGESGEAAKQPLPDFLACHIPQSSTTVVELHIFLVTPSGATGREHSRGTPTQQENLWPSSYPCSCVVILTFPFPPTYHSPVMPVATEPKRTAYSPIRAPRGNQL